MQSTYCTIGTLYYIENIFHDLSTFIKRFGLYISMSFVEIVFPHPKMKKVPQQEAQTTIFIIAKIL